MLFMKKSIKFARPRLLIVGCGDIGMRLLPLLAPHFRLFALTRKREQFGAIRAAGAVPVWGDLDQAATLARLAGLANRIIHLAPPPNQQGSIDQRTRNLAAILPQAARLVYISTSGVYGDCGGAWVDETRPVNPQSARAQRRVDAEQVLRDWARRAQGQLAIVRVPGIYAADRLPIARLQQGTPALTPADDVFTNHIHAGDLARIIVRTLWQGKPQRVYHAVDDSDMRMAEYFDCVADHFALSRPPRLARAALKAQVSPMLWSFMSESRRLANHRIKQELGVKLRYPTVADALAGLPVAGISK
jgi:nucleoside-diphosphate-sugar epimerase